MGRTHLTTAPGEPLHVDGADRHDERWSSGPRMPQEPTWAGPRRRLWIILLASSLGAMIIAAFVLANIRANSFDPTNSPDLFITESENDGLPGEG